MIGVKGLKPVLQNAAKNLKNTPLIQMANNSAMAEAAEVTALKTLAVTVPKPFVYHVQLNRPDRLNAINKEMWLEIGKCFRGLGANPDCRVIVLSGAGKHYTAGIDLKDMMSLGQELSELDDVARKGRALENVIKLYQDSITSLELCPKPVIAAVHSACIGAGANLITAADIRLCSKDAWFQVKEVEIGMAADVGALQRLPKAIGNQSLARELCLTGRKFDSDEAKEIGFVSRVLPDREALVNSAIELATTIAEKSPVAVQATKANMVYSLEHTNQEGLDHIRQLNKLNLQSEDFFNAVGAQLTKGDKPVFSKL